MNTFEQDMARGQIGEHQAKFWLNGVDFRNPPKPILDICDREGRIADRLPKEEMSMVFQKGYNKNRDYELNYSGRNQPIKLEVKTDFYAMVDKAGTHELRHTGNLFIEVDAANIENIDEVLNNRQVCKGYYENRSPWFGLSEESHADWYAFYVSTADYDENGEQVPQSDMTDEGKGGVKLTAEEINEFLHDNSLPINSSIITRWPFESFLWIRWDKLKEVLERHAGIRFSKMPTHKKGKVNIVLPLRLLMNELHPSQRDKWGKRIFAVPCCRTATRGILPTGADVRDLDLYIHNRMVCNVTTSRREDVLLSDIQYHPALNIRLENILKTDVPISITIIGQREGIAAYKDGNGKEYQFFNSLLSVRHIGTGIKLYWGQK